jgi:hypothetical protein
MSKRTSFATVIAVAGLLALPAVSSAQVPTQDSVTGSGVAQPGATFNFVFDVHSGPSGENPTGQVSFRFADTGEVFFAGPVTCLDVSGNFAILTVASTQFGAVGLEVTDSPAGDLIRAIPTGISTCAPLGSAVNFPVISGDVVVVDAPALPTSKDQCKNGGWRSYGVFKNQGDCVSFVATGGKNHPANP